MIKCEFFSINDIKSWKWFNVEFIKVLFWSIVELLQNIVFLQVKNGRRIDTNEHLTTLNFFGVDKK
jgi:hypothetical protein